MSDLTELKNPAILDASEAAHNAIEMIESRKAEVDTGLVDGIQFTVPELRDHCRPIYPSEVAYVIGHSRNGKSFLIKKNVYEETMKLFEKQQHSHVNVIVSWEEPAEILAMSWLAKLSGISSTAMLRGMVTDNELFNLKNNTVVQVGQYPIYIIGMSAKRSSDGKRHKVDLSQASVDSCLDWIMNKQGREIRMMALDYLQRIPQTQGGKREMHILNCVDWIKDIAFWTGAATMAATQAKQAVLEKATPLPDLYDSEWSANAAQSGDHAYSVYMPKTKYATGEWCDVGPYKGIDVTNDLQFVAVLKQKGDVDGQLLPMQIRPDKLDWRMHGAYYSSEWAKEKGHSDRPNREYL